MTLVGGKDNDNLSGGIGSDTYTYNTGDGDDQITDADAGDRVVIDGFTLTKAQQISESSNIYEADNNGVKYKLTVTATDGLFISVGSGVEQGTIHILNWDRNTNNFGISLQEKEADQAPGPAPEIFEIGDGSTVPIANSYYATHCIQFYHNLVAIEEANGIEKDYRNYSLHYVASVYRFFDWQYNEFGKDHAFSFYGGYKSDVLDGGEYSDILLGGQGDDVIHGNIEIKPGSEVYKDYLFGGAGSDWLYGASGDDFIFTNNPVRGKNVENYAANDESSIDWIFKDFWVFEGKDDIDRAYGGGGNDTISGQRYVDYISGDIGADDISGNAGNDFLSGGDGDDVIKGDSFCELHSPDPLANPYRNLTLLSIRYENSEDADLTYDDVIDGGEGNDRIYGEMGNDVITGGDGADIILGDRVNDNSNTLLIAGSWYGTQIDGTPYDGTLDAKFHGNDVIDGGTGEDLILGDAGNDVINGGADNDKLFGDDPMLSQAECGNDILDGGQGADTIFGNGGEDILHGGSENDLIHGDGSQITTISNTNDQLFGDAGCDSLYGDAGSDTLKGGADDDWLIGDDAENNTPGALQGRDVLFGEGGNDVLWGFGQGDELYGGDGQDTLYGDASPSDLAAEFHGNDYLSGGAGDDSLIGSGGRDSLYGGDGNDVINGDDSDIDSRFHGNDILSGDRGNDTLIGGGGNDSLYGGEGDDSISGDATWLAVSAHGNDYIDAGDGNDLVTGGAGDDTIISGAGNDSIDGGLGNDSIVGGSGDDFIFDADGNNVIYGGSGNDTIKVSGGVSIVDGGAGRDFIIVDGNGANVTINDTDVNTIRIGSGTEGYSLGLVGSSLKLSVASSGIQVNISNFDLNNPYASVNVDSFVFNNASLTFTELLDRGITFSAAGASGSSANVDGSNLNDILNGNQGNNLLSGFGGNDTLNGGGGDDTLIGGQGDDRYSVDSASDVIIEAFGEGYDLVTSSSSYVLSENIEQLRLIGGAVDATGNSGANDLSGNELDNTLSGKEGNDTLNGDVGNDTLLGGDGDDYLYGGAGNDTFEGDKGNDVITLESGKDTVIFNKGDGQDRVIKYGTTAEGAIVKFGEGITPENIKFVRWWSVNTNEDSLRLVLVENSIETGDYLHIENYFKYSNASLPVSLFKFSNGVTWDYANIKASFIRPTEGNDTLNGFFDSDCIDGLGGDDVVAGNGGDDSLIGGAGADTIYGGVGGDTLIGGVGNDSLDGGEGGDTLIGGVGNDSLDGGEGNDIYIYNKGDGSDIVIDSPDSSGSSNDVLRLGSGILPQNVTCYRTVSSDGSVLGDNLVLVFDNSNVQLCLAHYFDNNDYLIERIEFDNGSGPVWSKGDVLNLVQAGTQSTMTGSLSADTYNVDHEWDVIDEPVDGGVDTVVSSRTYSLPQNVENITLTGYLNINATGNGLDNTLRGNVNNNILDGGAGYDTGYGGAGDDTYISVENIVELAGEGTDTLIANAGRGDVLNMAENVENMKIYGSSYFARTAKGNSGNNYIYWETPGSVSKPNSVTGLTDGDVIDGGAGADTMVAGSGARFVVDNSGDVVIASSSGFDEVRTYINYVLPSEVENISLQGSSSIKGTGNSGNNILYSRDVYGAVCTLEGGMGDDRYVIKDGDVVVEMANGGNDTVVVNGSASAVEDFYLSNYGNVENITLQDNVVSVNHTNLNAYGSSENNNIQGNKYNNKLFGLDGNDLLVGGDGDDTLDGGAGADTLRGGSGSDLYVIDNSADVIEDSGNYGGAAYISVDYNIKAAVGSVYLVGESAINLIADNFVNQIFGNSANNIIDGGQAGICNISGGAGNDYISSSSNGQWCYLYGGVGNDTLVSGGFHDYDSNYISWNNIYGGRGNDVLIGGKSDDLYNFDYGDGSDVVLQNDAINDDEACFGQSTDRLWLSRSGQDLLVETIGTTDRVVFSNWFNGRANQLTYINSSDGYLDAAGVSRVVDYLSAYGNPVSGGAVITSQMWTDIHNKMSTEWQVTASDVAVSNPVKDILVSEGQSLSFVVPTNTFIDRSGGGLSFYASALDRSSFPAWLNFDEATHTFYGTPTSADVGSFDVVLHASTLLGSSSGHITNASSTFNVAVKRVNHAPVVVAALPDVSFQDGSNISLNVISGLKDNDSGDVVTYSVSLDNGASLPSWLTFDVNSGFLTGLPSENDVGTNNVKVTATDQDGLSVSDVFSLKIYSPDLTLTGTDANDTLKGRGGNDTLNGGLGADTMIGGIGDDSYYVDNAGDVVSEGITAGVDTVFTSVTFNLSENVEYISVVGNSVVNITGNALNNLINGNSSSNILDGGFGVDTLSGGLGDDTYVVDSSADSVIELANSGTDTVNSSDTYTLTDNVENLVLIGTLAINATGNASNNRIVGNSAANTLNGSLGIDTMIGGAGNDIYYVDSAADLVTENVSEGTDSVVSTVSYTLGDNVENLTLTGSTSINATGNILNNVLTGNTAANTLTGFSGNDTLDGGAGIDTLIGGTGDDVYYVDTSSDVVTELASEGTDLINSVVSYTLGANLENLTLGGTSAINATGNTLNNLLLGNAAVNTLTGAAGNDTLDGGAGADSMIGGMGDDTYYVDTASDVVTENASEGTDLINASVTFTLNANLENLTLTGTGAINGTGNTLNNILTGNSAANLLSGSTGNDTLIGGAGDDTLDGGAGTDSLVGGTGNDSYTVDATTDVITELAGEGTDLVNSSVTYTLGANIEKLTLTGTTAINGTGNTLENYLTGNSAVNNLAGGAGNDTLDGGAGIDTLVGGAGNDTYYIDTASDVITELASEGIDTVFSSLTYTLAANVENLTLTGTTAINGTGNTLDNLINGNAAANLLSGSSGNDTLLGAAGNDSLDGGTGNDSLVGGTGDDLYTVDSSTDVIVELVGEGADSVNSSVTYTLSDNIEKLTLTGTTAINATGNALANVLTGNSAANTLTGGAGNDSLNGGAGTDTMIGGTGDDVYTVDATADVITELASEGIDLVNSSVTYTLSANVDNLTLSGTTAINGIGNALNNVLTGNSAANSLTGGLGNDTLIGGAGADSMIGGAGDDSYIVDSTTDVITELASEGTDSVSSSVTYTLGNNVENLTLTGTTAINGTGNALNNVLVGNSAANSLTAAAGNDTLDGGAGIDTLVGGLGDDVYYIDNASDVVTENASEGTDTVNAAVTATLGNNVENLTLTGTTAINGTGNTLNNVITGNSAANILTGAAGNDTLVGAAGNDSLVGGTGNDTYVFGRGDGADRVTENDTTAGNTDVVSFLSGVSKDQLWFKQVNTSDLEVSVIGTTDKLTIGGWYSGTAAHVEQFRTADGSLLLDTKVQNLVNAMASLSAPAQGETTLSATYQNTLNPVIAANWS